MNFQSNKQNRKILIIEDDSAQLSRYIEMAREAGLDPHGARNESEAITQLTNLSFSYVLTDIHLGGKANFLGYEGISILKYIRENLPEVTALAMTSDPKIDTYHAVLKEGVAHLFRKPIISKDELIIHLKSARTHRIIGSFANKKQKDRALPEKIRNKYPDGIIVRDDLRQIARKIANHGSIPVVIYGETGTGKEEVAKLIHRTRVSLEGPIPFVPVNCANLNGDTAVSELFGHKKGSFTGAISTTSGFVGEANGGILFLDEIHALSIECQQRLLRVLNDGNYRRIGDDRDIYSNFQVIVATTRDLDKDVDEGNFLLDLRSRLIGIDLKLNPLRERTDELPSFIELFFARQGVSVTEEEINRIAKRCSEFYWRGNIRQLLNVLQTWIVQTEGDEKELRAENLPVYKLMMAPGNECHTTTPHMPSILPEDISILFAKSLNTDLPLNDSLSWFEKLILQSAINRHSKLSDVAIALGIGRTTLDDKRKKHGI